MVLFLVLISIGIWKFNSIFMTDEEKIKDLLTKCEFCTGKYCLRFFVTTKERGLCDKNFRQYFPVQTEQTRLIRDLLYGFVLDRNFCDFIEKTEKHIRCQTCSRIYLGHLLVQDSKIRSGSDFRRHYTA